MPTLTATNMDMMMLEHFAVMRRTEAHWRDVLAQAGLRVVSKYTYPGVAESLIGAQLAWGRVCMNFWLRIFAPYRLIL